MKRKIITSAHSVASERRYSPAVAVEGAQRLTFFSSILATRMRTVEEEARDVVDQLKALLEAAGLTADNLVKLTLYTRDLGAASVLHDELARLIAERPPALSEVEVSFLPRGRSLAIDAIAAS